ncbi:MAG: phytoene/squalene synthase family protein [Nevskia sp.]|jgi:farnesyl-diphosphate farnesyltransferase|nr:phytoene/squalene synthase family protein [Nevskia sp.]MCK9384732.1 phytoene/squalene synthase family protein [Nevskia sp.]
MTADGGSVFAQRNDPSDSAAMAESTERDPVPQDGARSVIPMTNEYSTKDALLIASSFQEHILAGVSRTFALTIPQLPQPLAGVVSNAYLLCRIADTIEDEPALAPEAKVRLTEQFAALVSGIGSIDAFVAELAPQLSAATSQAEHELVHNTALVLQVTHSFDAAPRAAIERCVQIMCRGMHRFQQSAGVNGLRDLNELSRYCYYVAGVVGEMLCALFCEFSTATAQRRETLMRYAVSFGQGLQMTNILKDMWEDRTRGVSWLPRAEFKRHGVEIAEIDPAAQTEAFARALNELIAVTHAQLNYALEYTLAISSRDTGIRKFCAWNIGMALLTLRKIVSKPGYSSAVEVKISRTSVFWVLLLTRIGIRSNTWLRFLFRRAASTLPQIDIAPAQAPVEA